MVDAREYHERSKHSPRSVRADEFELDFSTKPRPYKEYQSLPQRDLQADPVLPEVPALAAIDQAGPEPSFPLAVDSPAEEASLDLAALCYHATGVTKRLRRRGERVRFRSAACTGKLYHVDLYPVVGPGAGPAPGVYHYDPVEHSLERLREGDYRGVLAAATGNETGVADAPVTIVATSEWWRNAWKYRERTYRHAFWDSGTILANLLAAAHAGGHRAEVVTAFADDAVADLVAVDPDDEAPLELVPIGADDPAPAPISVDPMDPPTVPPSESIVDYPLVPDAWRQSRLEDGDAARRWRAEVAEAELPSTPDPEGTVVELDPVDPSTASSRPLTGTIERRGSLREYAHEPVSDRMLATVLDRALGPVPLDCLGTTERVVVPYCLVHAVDGIPGGVYRYRPAQQVLERVGDVDRPTAGHIALDQSVVGDAAVNVYLMADVERLVERFGNRAYRVAQLAAGIKLGRLYLATYAHRALGGRGFTFYDDAVTEQLSPSAADLTPMTLFAFGRPRA